MTQDVLHIRDAVSKTITVTPQMMTIISDLDRDEMVISPDHREVIENMFQFAYNRADEFNESANGVMLNISGGLYQEQIGNPAQAIYESVKE